jgi:hypothetical protein
MSLSTITLSHRWSKVRDDMEGFGDWIREAMTLRCAGMPPTSYSLTSFDLPVVTTLTLNNISAGCHVDSSYMPVIQLTTRASR